MKVLDYSNALAIAYIGPDTPDRSRLAQMLDAPLFRDATENCRFCGEAMEMPLDRSASDGPENTIIRVFSCSRCGWWHYAYSDLQTRVECKHGILRTYDPDSIAVPLDSLRSSVRSRPELLYKLHPTKMEELVGAVFRDHTDCDVIHVGKTGDGGIDLLLIDGNVKHIIQVKRRQNRDSTEGVQVIRELIGAMVLDKKRSGIFVSTADHFTRGAQGAAIKARELNIVDKIELIDMQRFIEIMQLTWPNVGMPWEASIESLAHLRSLAERGLLPKPNESSADEKAT